MPEQSKPFYRRNLPHWHPPDATIFLTWNLEGSLPSDVQNRLAATRTLLEREEKRSDESADQRRATWCPSDDVNEMTPGTD
jgi:hypothetical protein